LATPWTHRRFFDLLGTLGPLRVISVSGPSVFEALCTFGPYGLDGKHMNAVTGAYHWHLGLAGFGHLCTRDEVHARSGRRVLFFELREGPEERPFLRIYLYRPPGEAFDPEVEKRFAEAHAELAEGAALERSEPDAKEDASP